MPCLRYDMPPEASWCPAKCRDGCGVIPSAEKPLTGPLPSVSSWAVPLVAEGLSWEFPGTENGSPTGMGWRDPGGGQAGRWAGALLRFASWPQAGALARAAGPGPRTRGDLHAQPPPPPEEERGERLVELHASFRELFTFFCAHTTMHGPIRLVCSSQNRLKTASWGLLFLGALGALYWQFGLLFEQYWRYPVLMTVSVHSEQKLFPSVTLCDMNPHR